MICTDNISPATATSVATTTDLRDALTQLVADRSFRVVIGTLGKVCRAQAYHTRATTRDEALAMAWDHNAAQCERVARAAKPTEPTRERRCTMLGAMPEDLSLVIDAMPEPTRSIAWDYFNGSLPSTGRSQALRTVVDEVVKLVRVGVGEVGPGPRRPVL
jgi:hypothetical protein